MSPEILNFWLSPYTVVLKALIHSIVERLTHTSTTHNTHSYTTSGTSSGLSTSSYLQWSTTEHWHYIILTSPLLVHTESRAITLYCVFRLCVSFISQIMLYYFFCNPIFHWYTSRINIFLWVKTSKIVCPTPFSTQIREKRCDRWSSGLVGGQWDKMFCGWHYREIC